MANGLYVHSEIGPLKKVCLHRPGEELLNLTPDDLERLLFDDIPFLEVAQAEHDKFAELLREQGVEVLYLEKLVAEALDAAGSREEFTQQWLAESGLKGKEARAAVKEYMDSIEDTKAFVDKCIAGLRKNEIDLPVRSSSTLSELVGADQDGETDLLVDPMPNTYFTRDPFAVVGRGVNLNHMFSVTRNRETLLGKYIFRDHPEYKDAPLWYRRDSAFHTEGGDVLNINAHTLAIGISQRTSPDGIEAAARNLFRDPESKIRRVLAFDIPRCRAFMHLDTVFTQIDRDKFTIHPAILGPLTVYELTPGPADKGGLSIRQIDTELASILAEALGVDKVELILCGGGDLIAAAREQWNDGSNTLCIAPGKIVVYERNDITNKILKDKGIQVLEIPSAELSRGRGGPRCMSMPLVRDEL